MTSLKNKLPAISTVAWTTSKVLTAGGLAANSALQAQDIMNGNASYGGPLAGGMGNNANASLWANTVMAGIGAVLMCKNGFEAQERLRYNFGKHKPADREPPRLEVAAPNWATAVAATGARMALNVGNVLLANQLPSAPFATGNAALTGVALVLAAYGADQWMERRNSHAEVSTVRGTDPLKLVTLVGSLVSNTYTSAAALTVLPAAAANIQLAYAGDYQADNLPYTVSGAANAAAAILVSAALTTTALAMATSGSNSSGPRDIEQQAAPVEFDRRSEGTTEVGSIEEKSAPPSVRS